MPVYQYKASDKSGKTVQGTMEAATDNAVAVRLQQTGHVPIYINVVQNRMAAAAVVRRGRVKFSDLNMFTRQLYTLQKAGLPLVRSLNTLSDQASSSVLKGAIAQMVADIEAGSNFSASLERHPAIFSQIYINMIRSGELSGRLAETLERLAILGEHDELIRQRISGAMRYPFIVVGAIIIGFIVMITAVVPRFSKIYGQFKTELPMPTQILLGIHYGITHFWWLGLAGLVGLIVFLQYFTKTPVGRKWLDTLKLQVPIFGPLNLKMVMSRFCRMTGTLIESGVPILQILSLVADGLGNSIVAATVHRIKQSVSEGKGMSGSMQQSGMFPPIVVQMVSVGEETGKLDELLVHVSKYYDDQIDYTIGNLVSLVEPILIAVLGSAVLFMALGIFLPMWDLMKVFRS